MDKDYILKEYDRIDNEISNLREERLKIKRDYLNHLNDTYEYLVGKKVECKYGRDLNFSVVGYFGGYRMSNAFNRLGVEPIIYKIKKDGSPSKNTEAFHTFEPNFEIILAE